MLKKLLRFGLAALVIVSCGLILAIALCGLMGIPIFEDGFHDLPLETKLERARLNVIDSRAALSRFIQQHGYTPQSVYALYHPVKYGSASEGWFDPFSYSPILRQPRPLCMLNSSGTIVIHSIGPDETDQCVSVTYDPTNGMKSSGDIW